MDVAFGAVAKGSRYHVEFLEFADSVQVTKSKFDAKTFRITRFIGELENSAGAADQLAKTQMDALKGSIEEFKSSMEAAAITVGDKFAPAVRSVTDILAGLILSFNDLDSATQNANQVIMTSDGVILTTDGGRTPRVAITAQGILAERIVGVLGDFVSLVIGSGNLVTKINTQGISSGHANYSQAPFRVDMAGNVVARSIKLTGEIDNSTMISSLIHASEFIRQSQHDIPDLMYMLLAQHFGFSGWMCIRIRDHFPAC